MRKFFLPQNPISASAEKHDRHTNDGALTPDFGGIKLHQHPPYNWTSIREHNAENKSLQLTREIQSNDEKVAAKYWIKTHGDSSLDDYFEHTEDLEDQPQSCRRPSWKNRYYPSCNSFHELDLARDYSKDRAESVPGDDQVFDSFMISHGYFRDVWVVHQPNLDFKSILKTVRWKHKFDPEIYNGILTDALVMERMTISPRIVDVYGLCGTSVWVEALPHEVEEVIIPGDGTMNPEEMQNQGELKPMNDLTTEEKLDIALSMAESLADLHGYSGGVM